jgi:hypothetical protein
MVIIDSHDSAWQGKSLFKAVAAVRTNSESLTLIPKIPSTRNSKFAYINDEDSEDQNRKIVFKHLNLSHAPWRKLPSSPKRKNDVDQQIRYQFLAIEVIDCLDCLVSFSFLSSACTFPPMYS